MASKRSASPGPENSLKKPKQINTAVDSTSIADLTPNTATHPQPTVPMGNDKPSTAVANSNQAKDEAPSPKTADPTTYIIPEGKIPDRADLARAINSTHMPWEVPRAQKVCHYPIAYNWVVVEIWHPKDHPDTDKETMVKILGLFEDKAEAMESGYEQVMALRELTQGSPLHERVGNQELDEEEEAWEVMEKKNAYFFGRFERIEEEDREDGGREWRVFWGDMTEVRAEKRAVYRESDDAGTFIPLPLVGFDSRDEWRAWEKEGEEREVRRWLEDSDDEGEGDDAQEENEADEADE